MAKSQQQKIMGNSQPKNNLKDVHPVCASKCLCYQESVNSVLVVRPLLQGTPHIGPFWKRPRKLKAKTLGEVLLLFPYGNAIQGRGNSTGLLKNPK